MIRIDHSFDGRELEISVGETLEIGLPQNAATGYKWTLAPDFDVKCGKILIQREQTTEWAAKLPGSPGVTHLTFEAILSWVA